MFRFLVRTLLIGVVLVVATLAVIALFSCWPSQRAPIVFKSHPLSDYAAARAVAAQLLAKPNSDVRPDCHTSILDHGHRTRDAYVLIHGLTNCPAQFRKFGDILFANGANVIIPRVPYHGFRDRMTPDLALLTAQEMVDSASRAVDIAHGYGERVIVVGLSISGVTAAWLAQQRGDIDLAVAIAPFLAPNGIPNFAVAPLTNLLLRLPNAFIWWDSSQKETLAGSPVSYPRFSTHAIGETMALGLDLFARAEQLPPATRKILLISSTADTAISKPRLQQLDALWKSRATDKIFPAEWQVPHDCIDPAQPGARVDLVYPQLIEWFDDALRP